MEIIKKYFSAWDFTRILRIILGGAMLIGFISTKENIYLFGGIFLSAQAILNFGCPGGTCSAPVNKNKDKQVMEFDTYKPIKEKTDV